MSYNDAYGWSQPGDVPEFNVELAKQALKWVRYEAERDAHGKEREWLQTEWFREYLEQVDGQLVSCGTACCVAGWVVQQAGGVFRGNMGRALDGGAIRTAVKAELDGRIESIPNLARELLGISVNEAGVLFSGTHLADEIAIAFQRIAEHRGVEW